MDLPALSMKDSRTTSTSEILEKLSQNIVFRSVLLATTISAFLEVSSRTIIPETKLMGQVKPAYSALSKQKNIDTIYLGSSTSKSAINNHHRKKYGETLDLSLDGANSSYNYNALRVALLHRNDIKRIYYFFSPAQLEEQPRDFEGDLSRIPIKFAHRWHTDEGSYIFDLNKALKSYLQIFTGKSKIHDLTRRLINSINQPEHCLEHSEILSQRAILTKEIDELEILEKTISLAKQSRLDFVLITLPVVNKYYSQADINRFRKNISKLADIAGIRHHHFGGNVSSDIRNFCDPVHFSERGANVISKKLDLIRQRDNNYR